MVVSHAELDIVEGQGAAFEKALAQAREVIGAADGLISLRIGRGVESPNRYLVTIEWDSLESHTVRFRESDGFLRWRDLISPFFAGPATVGHFEPLTPPSTRRRP